MILRNFSAVNESSRNGDSLGKGDGSKEPEPQFHQELEEDKYVSLYSRALGLYGSGRYAECLQDFLVIFESEYFKLFGRESPRPSPVAVKLQKCVAKYLGFCYEKENNHRECIKYLKESLSIDDSDVTLYFKVALSAIKMHNLSIARSALEAGLRVSPEHWPSLELAIMVSFKTKDHFGCLQHIHRALTLDPSYSKALMIKDQIALENKHFGIDLGLNLHDPKAKYTPSVLPSLEFKTSKLLPKRKIIIDKSFFHLILTEFHRDYNSIMSQENAASKAIEPVLLVEKAAPPKIFVSVQNTTNEIVDFVIQEKISKETESERIVKNILMNEVLANLSLFSTHDFVDEIINDMIDLVVASGSDFLVNLQATEIRRSSRARVTVIDKTDSDSAGNSRSVPVEDPIHSYLASFIPDALLNPPLNDVVENDVNEEDKENGTQIGKSSSFEKTITGDLEIELIMDFVSSFISSLSEQGVLSIIEKTCIYLFNEYSSKYNWNYKMMESFYALYLDWRHHFVFPDFYEPEVQIYFTLMIFANEVALDIEKRAIEAETLGSPEKDIARPPGFYKYLKSDLKYMALNSYELDLDWQIRIASIEFEHMIINEDGKSAHKSGQKLKELYNIERKAKIILLPFSHYQVCSSLMVDETLESLKRNGLVDKISSLFKKKDYSTVISVLQGSLSQKVDERAYQISLLIDSHWNLDNYSNCLKWSCIALCDFIEEKTKLNNKEGTNSRRGAVEDFTWTVDCFDLLKTIECCLLYTSMKKALSLDLKSRLLKQLLKIIVIQIDFYAKQFVIKSTLPWIFVYRLIESENDSSHPEIAFLISSHDYLGQLSLCTEDHGKLLLLLLDDGFSKKALPKKAIEQALFCLFSHPSKKSRVKHLTDHGVSQIALTFDKSLLVFSNYLRPSTIPEFDDFKSNSISNDTEHFFKRMVALMPSDESGLNREETMMQSITFGKKVSLSKKGIPFNTELKDFYYLLADFYFKNSEFKPAISYYLLDLSYNEKRIDSWIALSLALANRVEEGINDVFKPTNHKDILKHFNDASNCFQFCISHKPRGATVYIEYANFCYVMHSFCTRTLESVPETLSIDTFQTMEKIKETSLDSAEMHYWEAFKIVTDHLEDMNDDERWLLYLMLGKIKEKKGKSFVEALKIYMKSLDNLLYQGANITKKISYNAPQDLSLELLEVYYRIHTSTLKRRAQNFTLEESQQILKILNEAHEKVGNFNKNISEPPLEKIPKLSEEEDPQKLRSIIIDTCLQGLEFTVKYFSQHFRAFFVLSNYYAKNQNFKKARIYLLGADTSNKNASGLFVDRKSNNLYNGIWRSPLTELDRAGGFTVHISKATSLLLDVLLATDEYQTLAEVTAMLKRPPPDGERTYLNDSDRITFARQAQTFYSRSVSSAVKKAKSSAQTRPVETVKKLLELQQVYAKTRKTFREDSVRAMLIDLLNTIGIKCSGYDEVASFCQRLNAEKGILDEYSKNFEKIQTACFDNKSLSSSSDPIPFLSSSLPTLNTVNSGIVSTPAIGVNPSPKPPKSTVIPSTSAPTTALDLSKTSFTIGETTINCIPSPSSPSILSQTSSSPLFSNTNKKFSSATAYKASSALSSSILKPSSTKSSTLPLSSLNKKILGSKVPTSSPKGIKTSSPKVMNTSSPKVMNTSSPKVMNTSSPNVMNISSTKVMDISSSKVTRTPSPKVVSSLTKGSLLIPKTLSDKNPFVVPTAAILSPPRQFGKGITIQRKTFLPPNSKKLSKSKSFDGTVSPKLKSIVKPNEIRNQLKNFRVNLHSVLKKSKSAKDLANNPSLSPNHNNSNITTPSNLSSKRTLPTSPLPLSTSTPYPKMISKEAPCPVPVTLNNKDKKTDIDVICID